MASAEALYQIADELRSIASQGLLYAENNYDKDRCLRIMAASARLVGAIEQWSSEDILLRFQDNLFHISPVVGAEVGCASRRADSFDYKT